MPLAPTHLSVSILATIDLPIDDHTTVEREVELSAEFDACYDAESRCCEPDREVIRVDGVAQGIHYRIPQVLQDAIDAALEAEYARIAAGSRIAQDRDRALGMIGEAFNQAALDREQAGRFGNVIEFNAHRKGQ